jgi:hypothetical protein
LRSRSWSSLKMPRTWIARVDSSSSLSSPSATEMTRILSNDNSAMIESMRWLSRARRERSSTRTMSISPDCAVAINAARAGRSERAPDCA